MLTLTIQDFPMISSIKKYLATVDSITSAIFNFHIDAWIKGEIEALETSAPWGKGVLILLLIETTELAFYVPNVGQPVLVHLDNTKLIVGLA